MIRRWFNPTDVIIRGVPGTVWVRLFVSLSGRCDPAWRGSDLYLGMVRRYAWTVRGIGPGVMWMRKGGPR